MLTVDKFLADVSPHEKTNLSVKNLVLMTHVLCSTYGWDYNILMRQPIPFVFALMEGISIQAKEEERMMKKKK